MTRLTFILVLFFSVVLYSACPEGPRKQYPSRRVCEPYKHKTVVPMYFKVTQTNAEPKVLRSGPERFSVTLFFQDAPNHFTELWHDGLAKKLLKRSSPSKIPKILKHQIESEFDPQTKLLATGETEVQLEVYDDGYAVDVVDGFLIPRGIRIGHSMGEVCSEENKANCPPQPIPNLSKRR